jgi:hypothetical protein
LTVAFAVANIAPMATKNHSKSMSQPERAFWRDVFLRRIHFWDADLSIQEATKRAGDYADEAVLEYRKRVTWRT